MPGNEIIVIWSILFSVKIVAVIYVLHYATGHHLPFIWKIDFLCNLSDQREMPTIIPLFIGMSINLERGDKVIEKQALRLGHNR